MALHFAINALYLIPGGVGGTEIYLREILSALAQQNRGHRFTVFCNLESGRGLVPDSPHFEYVNTGVRATSRPARILHEQTVFASKLRRGGFDAVLNPGFTSPLFSGIPNVTVIHDLQHLRHPEYFKWMDLIAWRFFVWASAHKSRALLTVSEASKEDICTTYHIEPERVFVAEPGVAPVFFDLQRNGSEKMILCVSTLHPHKNIERLVDAFAIFSKDRPGWRLVLAGMRGFRTEAIVERIGSLGLHERIAITGWLQRGQVLELYAKARLAVFPSTFEGFGIPVIEALAAGVPLITANSRPMCDIAADAALLFPAHDTDALAHALLSLADNPELCASLAARGKIRAKNFTWENAAARTLDALEFAVS